MEMEDELRAEYDLHSLRVRKLGSGRKSFGGLNTRRQNPIALRPVLEKRGYSWQSSYFNR